jgi:DNA-binding MarR family transcriptional regulator
VTTPPTTRSATAQPREQPRNPPVEVDPHQLALFTQQARRMVSVLAADLDRTLTVRELSDASDVPIATARHLLVKLTAPGLVHVTEDEGGRRGRQYRLTAAGLRLYTLAQPQPIHRPRRAAKVTLSHWHPPAPADPAAIDTDAVERLRRWLNRNGGEATRYQIHARRVAGTKNRADVDRLLAHYHHIYPETIYTRTTGHLLTTLLVRSPSPTRREHPKGPSPHSD